jgi:hypothetical protein
MKASGQAIRSGPWWTESHIEKLAFTGAHLSNVRVIMVIMRVLVDESLCQAVMGHITVLECLFVKCAWVPVARSCHA